MTDEMKIARRVQKNLRRIGVASTIEVKDDMTLVSGNSNGRSAIQAPLFRARKKPNEINGKRRNCVEFRVG